MHIHLTEPSPHLVCFCFIPVSFFFSLSSIFVLWVVIVRLCHKQYNGKIEINVALLTQKCQREWTWNNQRQQTKPNQIQNQTQWNVKWHMDRQKCGRCAMPCFFFFYSTLCGCLFYSSFILFVHNVEPYRTCNKTKPTDRKERHLWRDDCVSVCVWALTSWQFRNINQNTQSARNNNNSYNNDPAIRRSIGIICQEYK